MVIIMKRRIDFTRVNDEINQVFYKEKNLDDILDRLSGKQNLFKMIDKDIDRRMFYTLQKKFFGSCEIIENEFSLELIEVMYDKDSRTKTERYNTGVECVGYYDKEGYLFKEDFSSGYIHFYNREGKKIKTIERKKVNAYIKKYQEALKRFKS